MAAAWDVAELAALDSSQELDISTVRADGSHRGWTPIWVVTTDHEVFVRTWHRRSTGWYGDAVARPVAEIRVPGVEAAVHIDDVGVGAPDVRARVDAAYVKKYGAGQMTDDATAASTLRLRKR